MMKEKILIVDDSEVNRSILADMLGENYEILEAEDGVQAVATLQTLHNSISLVLLDINMPHMDGFGVLETMNEHQWIEETPVVMISAEREAGRVERAYALGVTDFIARPFDTYIVRNRVVNTLLLYAKQKHLLAMVQEQLNEKEKTSAAMIDILSHIVEVRNGESGLHVLHVRAITDFLLRKLRDRTDEYDLTDETISLISNASALHDIGKICIDEKILNKPGRLTKEEFEIMKQHALLGARMLEGESIHQDHPLVRTAYEICRWHHERYDGHGYPDGLSGNTIPISAQVVALADVYDALTSSRVYKAAYTHEEAVRMILNGECGSFNPLLLECLQLNSEGLKKKLEGDVAADMNQREVRNVTEAVLNGKVQGMSERTLRLLDYERMKNNFFSAMTEEIQFEYTMSSHILTLSSWGAKKLGVNEVVLDAYNDDRVQEVIGGINWHDISMMLLQTTPEHPEINFECKINCNGEMRWHRVVIRAVWSASAPFHCDGALGKAIDIHETRMEMDALKRNAARDTLTGLLNLATAKFLIEEQLSSPNDKQFVMVYFDLDYFKAVNDTYGHQFGNEVLQHVSAVLDHGLRNDDIACRFGGDEFLLFLECGGWEKQIIRRIFAALTTPFKDYPISVSMGVALSSEVGASYEAMFQAADRALYYAKEKGRGQYCFYDPSMKDALLSIPTALDD